MAKAVGVIGECMVELSPAAGGWGAGFPAMISYGGDTLNTAVYLARLGVGVDYITALGDDPLSDWMIGQWRGEGVGCDQIRRYPDVPPGLYLIQIDDAGERSFIYWRDNSAARRLFTDLGAAREILDRCAAYDALYLSGITLSLCSPAVRQRLYDFAGGFRARGGSVIFDGNYRERQWRDRQQALADYQQMYRLTDIALPTVDDEILLFGEDSEAQVIDRLKSWGIKEIILKKGAAGCVVVSGEDSRLVPAEPMGAVDTTAAGDSFNAGYLAASFDGKDAATAAAAGHRLASVVVQHRGAIIPRRAMPGALERENRPRDAGSGSSRTRR